MLGQAVPQSLCLWHVGFEGAGGGGPGRGGGVGGGYPPRKEHAGHASSHNSTRPHRVANVVLMQPGRDPRQGRLEGTTGNGGHHAQHKARPSCKLQIQTSKPCKLVSSFQAMGRTHHSGQRCQPVGRVKSAGYSIYAQITYSCIARQISLRLFQLN